jgi:tetratricopeptide (TPR) repeat protein
VGINPVSDDAWTRAHQTRLGSGDVPGAVRCAFWLAFRLVNAFDRPEGNGWIARIERLVEPASPDSIEAGRLAYLTGLRAAFEGDLDTAATDLARSAEIASLWRDDELAALARLSLGRVRIFLGEITPGVRMLDEAMLVVRSAAMSPIAVGDSYCTAIDACYDLFDVQRGQAWTKGLTDWCAPQPDLVPFAGVCQVHRSEFLQLEGAWVEAMAQAGLARARLAQPFRQLPYGAAVYQQGELHRLLGEFDHAEACYREASSAGRDPQPGLALLRLHQRRREEAAQAIDRALAEAEDPIGRSWLLDAYVEIMLANDRVVDAKSGAAQLAAVASGLSSPMLDAVARRASGAVRLAENDPRGALGDLRKASDGFRELAAPHEVARCEVLIGRARRSACGTCLLSQAHAKCRDPVGNDPITAAPTSTLQVSSGPSTLNTASPLPALTTTTVASADAGFPSRCTVCGGTKTKSPGCASITSCPPGPDSTRNSPETT